MTDLESRVPPHELTAERNVLGSVIRDNAAIHEVLAILREENFYHDAHRKIFAAIIDLFNVAKPIDPTTLYDRLKKKKQLDDIGGPAYIAELWDSAPTAANALHYAAIIRDKSILRSLIYAHAEGQREAFEAGQSPEELLAVSERRIMDIADRGATNETATLRDSIKLAFERFDARAGRGEGLGVKTGYIDLDERTGGLQNSELTIIAARPSIGKTALALNIIRNIITEENAPAYFVSLEQTKTEIAERLLICQARVNSHHVRTGRIPSEQIERLMEAQQLFCGDESKPVKLFIDDTPAQSLLRIASTARRLKRREGIKVLFIDYLQLIEPEDRRAPRQEQVAFMSRRLKTLARELEIPVVALSQVNRQSEDRQDNTPRLGEMRESGAIEQDADTVFILHRPKERNDGPNSILEVHVAKQRNGPPGVVGLACLKSYMRYENASRESTNYLRETHADE